MPLQLDRMAELDAALEAGALLLVPNFRSSDQLVDQLCRYRRRVLPTALLPRPAIRAVDLWLEELWQQLGHLHHADTLHWRVLQPAEEQVLWQRLIRKTSPELLLLNQDGTAVAAASAWRLLQQWQIPLPALRQHLVAGTGFEQKDDREYAWSWLQAFEQHCQRNHLLSFSGMLQQLLQFVDDGTLSTLGLLPSTLWLAGFDAPPPLYQALFAAISAQGTKIGNWHFDACRPQLSLQRCKLPADECRAAAAWAAEIHARDPGAVIGIVTADSDILKHELSRCFAQEFADRPAAYSSTLPGTLADTPFVHTALLALALLDERLAVLDCCALLRSPWLLAATAEQDARAELELRLRRTRALHVRSSELRALCLDHDKPWHNPQLGAALLQLRQEFLRLPRRQDLYDWLQFFSRCWDTLLPRGNLLQSGDRALVKAWEAMLKLASASSELYGPGDFAGARSLFSRLCRASTLPTGRSQAPILLLTPVTAAGLHFSHLWCMQMTEGLWPGEQQPHPYLPLALQYQHGLPGVDRGQALQVGSDLLQGLSRRTSGELVFSHAETAEDLPQRMTALVPSGLPERARLPALVPGSLHPALLLMARLPLELWQDSTHLPLAADTSFQGGSGVLASQSTCPFKGFAEYRLRARELLQPAYGIPPQALGDCVHEALRGFWHDMQDQAALLATDQASLEQAVQRALMPALQELVRLYPEVLTPTLQTLEVRRLTDLLLRWLDVEKLRGPFAVQATEEKLVWALPSLQLRVKLDRIDRLADGSSAIVDYKTGKTVSMRWEDERPAAPQLLVYQQAVDADSRFGQASALLYAGINVEELDYSGIAAHADTCPGLDIAANRSVSAPDWQSLKERWRDIIAGLADEFIQGYAAVQPARKDSCIHCHLGSLCRIAELRLAAEEDEA